MFAEQLVGNINSTMEQVADRFCHTVQKAFNLNLDKMRKTSIREMGKMEPLSKEWFDAAFEDCEAPDFAIFAAEKICVAFRISGQADPGYIANVIAEKFNRHWK